jgi:hypothetical protein
MMSRLGERRSEESDLMVFDPPPEDRDEFHGSMPRQPPGEWDRAQGLLHAPAPSLDEILPWTWAIFRARMPACFGAYWGATGAAWLILLAIAVLLSGLNDLARDPMVFDLLRFLLFLAELLVPAWLVIGQNLTMLKLARQEPVAPEDLFRGGRYLLTTLLALLVFLAAAGLPLLFLARVTWELVDQSGDLALAFAIFLAGLGLGTVVVFAILVRLGQFAYLIVDRNAGSWEAFRGSWLLTRGRTATVILVYLLYLTINFAGLLALCIGLVFTLPLSSLLLAVTYHALSESAPDPVREKPGPWEEGAS